MIYYRTSKLIRGDENTENKNGTSSPSDGASCSESSYVSGGADQLARLLKDFEETGQRGIEMEKEYFKNRQPKGYKHLPNLVDDLREMSKLLPSQTHDLPNQDEPSLLQGLLHS